MSLRDSPDVQEDHTFLANASLNAESASSSSSAQNELGHIPPGSITGRLSPDFLLFGYNQNGRTRAWRLLRSNIPLASSQDRLPGNVVRLLYAHLSVVERGLHRPATDSEAEAYAKWAYAQNRSQTQYLAVGFAAAGIFTYRRSSAFRFPLYTPPNPEFFNYFPSPGFSFLKGSNARLMWHVGVRYPLYAVCSVLASGPIGTFMSGLEAELGLQTDPRTKHIREARIAAMKGRMDETRQRVQRGPTGQPRDQRPNFPKSAAGGQTPQAESSTNNEPTYNEMDQNTRSFEDFNRDTDTTPSSSSGATDTGILTTSQMRSRDMQRRPNPSSNDPTNQGSFSMDRAPSDQYQSSSSTNDNTGSGSSSSSFYGDNNLSPWNSPSESSSSSSSDGGGGGASAWDRVRAGASDSPLSSSSDPSSPRFDPSSTTQPSSPPSSRRQSSGFWGQSRSGASRDPNETKADSFSFSGSERERVMAKEQAQREFDEMVERERRGEGGG
ncbi:MAG: hypothetical protein Q9160_005451 [Pyrenula sp. 1 TL-2023]